MPKYSNPSLQHKQFMESAQMNDATFCDWFYRFQELAINMFKWNGFPVTIAFRLVLIERYSFRISEGDEFLIALPAWRPFKRTIIHPFIEFIEPSVKIHSS